MLCSSGSSRILDPSHVLDVIINKIKGNKPNEITKNDIHSFKQILSNK